MISILLLLTTGLPGCRTEPPPTTGQPKGLADRGTEMVAPPDGALASHATASIPYPTVLLRKEIPVHGARPSTADLATGGDPDTAATLVGPVEVSVLEELAHDGDLDGWMRVRAAGGTEGWIHEHHTAIVRTFTLAQLRDMTRGGAPFPLLTGWWVAEAARGAPSWRVNGFLEVNEAGFVGRPEALYGEPSPETMDADHGRWMSTWYKPGTTYALHRPGQRPATITVGGPHRSDCTGFAVEASADGLAGRDVPTADFLVTPLDQVRRVPPFRALSAAEIEVVQHAARAGLSAPDVAALARGPTFEGGIAFDADADGVSDLVAAVSFEIGKDDPTIVDLLVLVPSSPADARATVLAQNRGMEERRMSTIPLAPLDVDDDGAPELVVAEHFYETSMTAILRRSAAGWKRAYGGGSHGC